MHKIRYNLPQLRIELQYRTKREFTWSEIAEATDITERTIYAWVHNRTSRVDMALIGRMLDFFHKQGYKIELKDFFTVTNEPEPPTNPTIDLLICANPMIPACACVLNCA